MRAITTASVFLACALAEAREPTEFEQYMLELINFARAYPDTEVARLASNPRWEGTPDLNEGLTPWTIPAEPKQPLAFSLNLVDAASDYSDDLLAADAFTHYLDGTSPAGRMAAAGYPYTNASSENLAVTASSWQHLVTRARVDDHHAALFIDADSSSRGHRINLMRPEWREIGIGIREGPGYELFGSPLNAVLTAQDFALTGATGHGPFLTGVAFDDLDLDGFYTPGSGEALGGLTVEVVLSGTDALIASATTFASGGYAVSLPDGIYDVRFSGPSVEELFVGVDFTSGQSVKLDAINLNFPLNAPGDLDEDGDVDGNDFISFAICYNGSLKPPQFACPNSHADIDGDGDVDGDDFLTFATCYNGSLKPPKCQ